MLKNHLKIIFRNIMRHKGYSFINISGLAVGMACTILIFLWVQYELSYDRFHENGKQVYRVNLEEHRHDGIHHHPWTPFPLAGTLKDQFTVEIPPCCWLTQKPLLSPMQWLKSILESKQTRWAKSSALTIR